MNKEEYESQIRAEYIYMLDKQQQELERYKNIVDELEQWLNETQINSQFIDEETIMEVRSKLKELKGSDK